jgi:serine-type D-Ala-D-Ala carboxypeptidase (penicillin-binding protein 5/6)
MKSCLNRLWLLIITLGIAASVPSLSAAEKSAPSSSKSKTGAAVKKSTSKKSPPKAAPKPAPKPAAPKTPTLAREPYLGAIVVDAEDGRVLFEDNADAKGYPASVLKLMLLLTAMEQIKAGTLTLEDEVPVHASAVSSDGANLKLKEGESFPVAEMLYASMMHSANDAATALAEKLGGSLSGYLEIINRRAQELGMVNSRFVSASGLGPKTPDGPYDITTPRDLTLLCREVLKHPEALRFTAARERVFRPDAAKPFRMDTHNYILGMVKGCDGLKTGYIRAAGYCIAGTAERNGRRVIAVLLGATSEKSRNKIAANLLEKGFNLLAKPPKAIPVDN